MIFRGYCFTGMYYKSMTIVVIERCFAVIAEGMRAEDPSQVRKRRGTSRPSSRSQDSAPLHLRDSPQIRKVSKICIFVIIFILFVYGDTGSFEMYF